MKFSKMLILLVLATSVTGCNALKHANATRELKSGMQAYQAGKASEATQHFLTAAETDPDFAEPMYYLGQIYHQSLKDPVKAIEYYKAADQREPENPQILYVLGSAYSEAEQPRDAVASLEKAVKLKPDFARAWFRLGNARQATRDYSGAVDAYMAAINADPEMMMSQDDPGGMAYHSLASLYQDFDINDKALAVYEDGLRTNPNSVRLMVGLGAAALAQRNYEKAEIALANALEKEPGNSYALFNRAVALMKLNRGDAAARSFEAFVKAGGGSPEQVSAAKAFINQIKEQQAQ